MKLIYHSSLQKSVSNLPQFHERIVARGETKIMFQFILMASLVLSAFGATGCSSASSRTDYDDNLMFGGQAPPAKHERRVNMDFFNKVCSPNGSSSNNGKEYECHYTGE